jgi:hypothetical protein
MPALRLLAAVTPQQFSDTCPLESPAHAPSGITEVSVVAGGFADDDVSVAVGRDAEGRCRAGGRRERVVVDVSAAP